MIELLVLLGVLGVILGVGLCLSAQRGRQVVLARRMERARIERQTRWAERRLHDIAHRAFSTMTEEARQAHGDTPWSA